MTLFFIVAFVYAVLALQGHNLVVRAFPWLVSFVALALLAVQLLSEVVKRDGREAPSEKEEQLDIEFTEEEATAKARRRSIEIFGWLYGFLVALWAFGFHLAFPALAFFYLLRHRLPWLPVVLMTVSFWLAIRVVFQELLHIPFPRAALFDIRDLLP
jgi:hypothetical protein